MGPEDDESRSGAVPKQEKSMGPMRHQGKGRRTCGKMEKPGPGSSARWMARSGKDGRGEEVEDGQDGQAGQDGEAMG